jgi:hypothetical protein
LIGNAVAIAGLLYASDFPEEVRTIKAMQDALGFSFEAQRLDVLDLGSAVLTIQALTFTGAAILRKDKAAYQMTSLAASAARAHTSLAAASGAARAHTEITHMDYVTQTEFPKKTPLKPFPCHFGNAQSLLKTLDYLGFNPPTALQALAAAGQPLGSGGHGIDAHEFDGILAGFDIDTRKRIQLKTMMRHQGLLK